MVIYHGLNTKTAYVVQGDVVERVQVDGATTEGAGGAENVAVNGTAGYEGKDTALKSRKPASGYGNFLVPGTTA
jgi:hypothetical protein